MNDSNNICKEKAIELMNKFEKCKTNKEFALITIDEIIAQNITFIALPSYINKYWEGVKKEIENL